MSWMLVLSTQLGGDKRDRTADSYNIDTVKGTAASRVFCRLKAEAVE